MAKETKLEEGDMVDEAGSSTKPVSLFQPLPVLPSKIDFEHQYADGYFFSPTQRDLAIQFFENHAATYLKNPYGSIRRYGPYLVALYESDKKHIVGTGSFGKVKIGQVIHIFEKLDKTEEDVPTLKQGEIVAIKSLIQKPFQSSESNFYALCDYEFNALQIVNLGFGIVKTKSKKGKPKASILMKFLSGPDLHKFQKNMKQHGSDLPPERILEIFLYLSQKLEKVHNQNIIHDDLKANNVVLNGNDAEIIDFAQCMQLKQDNEIIELPRPLGNILLQPPEVRGDNQRHGSSQFSKKSDVYSFGLMLLFFLGLTTVPHKDEMNWIYPAELRKWEDIKKIRPPVLPLEVLKPLYDLLAPTLSNAPQKRPTIGAITQGLNNILEEYNRKEKSHRVAVVNHNVFTQNDKRTMSLLFQLREIKVEIPYTTDDEEKRKWAWQVKKLQEEGFRITGYVMAPDPALSNEEKRERSQALMDELIHISKTAAPDKVADPYYITAALTPAEKLERFHQGIKCTTKHSTLMIGETKYLEVLTALMEKEGSLAEKIEQAKANPSDKKHYENNAAIVRKAIEALHKFYIEGCLDHETAVEIIEAAQQQMHNQNQARHVLAMTFSSFGIRALTSQSEKDLANIKRLLVPNPFIHLYKQMQQDPIYTWDLEYRAKAIAIARSYEDSNKFETAEAFYTNKLEELRALRLEQLKNQNGIIVGTLSSPRPLPAAAVKAESLDTIKSIAVVTWDVVYQADHATYEFLKSCEEIKLEIPNDITQTHWHDVANHLREKGLNVTGFVINTNDKTRSIHYETNLISALKKEYQNPKFKFVHLNQKKINPQQLTLLFNHDNSHVHDTRGVEGTKPGPNHKP